MNFDMISLRNTVFNIIFKVVNEKNYNRLPELIEVLNKHRSIFVNLLENEPMNNNDRNSVLNSYKEPIEITGIPQKVCLTNDYINETIIISDLFHLNELIAVELLLSGEADCSSHRDMTRGLLAVLNYYHSQKTLIDSLKLLLKAKLILINENNSDFECAEASEVVLFIERYLDDLFNNNNILCRILLLIKSMDIDLEIVKLEGERALGCERHRRQFVTVFESIKSGLCDCVMLRCYRAPLSGKQTVDVVNILRELYYDNICNNNGASIIKKEESTLYECKSIKIIDKYFVYLLVSILNSINPVIDGNYLTNFSEQYNNDYQKSIDKILKHNFKETVDVITNDTANKTIHQNFDQLLYLSWIISLQKVSHLRKDDNNINYRFDQTKNFGDYDEEEEMETLHIDCQIVYECFQFLIEIISIDSFHEENIWVKCFHNLVTDFIIYMPKMLKDLRTESTRSKSNVLFYCSILELIGRLYGGADRLFEEPQENPLINSLVLDYWSPQEIINYFGDSTTLLAFDDNFKSWNIKQNDSYKQAVLFKFIRDSGDLIEHPQMFINYVFMLKGLCCNDRVALYIYSLLNNNQISHQTSRLTWEWFSNSLQKHAQFLMTTAHKQHIMAPSELNGLLVVLRLIRKVTHNSSVACSSMINNESLSLLHHLIMLLSCRLPEILKAEIINCLSVFSSTNSLISKSIWHTLINNNNNMSPENNNNNNINTIIAEMDIIEPKNQQYFITRAFINLLLAQLSHIGTSVMIGDHHEQQYNPLINQSAINLYTNNWNNNNMPLENFTSVLRVVMDTVFIKHTMRTYKNIEEKFVICATFLKLCSKCVDIFLTQAITAKITKSKLSWCLNDPGFFIITQLLNDSLFFKTIISIIDTGFCQINDSLNNVTFGSRTLTKDCLQSLQSSVYYALNLVSTVLNREAFLVQLVREVNSYKAGDIITMTNSRQSGLRNLCVPQELSRLLINNTQHFLSHLIKYVSIVDESEQISRKALSILNSCIDIIEPHSNLMLMVTNKNVIDIDIVSLFVNCIDKCGDIEGRQFIDVLERKGLSSLFFKDIHRSNDSPRTIVLKIIINSLAKQAPNLGHYLMGFSCDNIQSLKRTSLQEAGVGDCAKTCLHSLLNLIIRLSSDILSSNCFNGEDIDSDELVSLTVNMIDLCLSLNIIYMMASDCHTSVTILRFIRSNYQLIFNQLDLLSFSTEKVAALPELRALFWNQKSWLLKIVAIEVRQCTANQQKSYVTKLLKLLFGDDFFEQNNETVFSKFYKEEEECQGLLYQVLQDCDVTEREENIDFSNSFRFRAEILKEYLSQCEEESNMKGLRVINSELLKELIMTDVSVTCEEEQLVSLQKDIGGICIEIEKYNRNEIWLMFGKNSLMEGWRQIVEVVFVMMIEYSDNDGDNNNMVVLSRRVKKMMKTVRLVMEKILVSTTPDVLVTTLSSVCLVLIAVMAKLFVDGDDIVGDLIEEDNNNNSGVMEELRLLLKLTADCILKINTKHQSTRIKFYAVFTYLTQITLKIDSLKLNMFGTVSNDCNNVIIVNNCLSIRSLYPTLCRDAVSGNIHLALSSLTLLDSLSSLDKGQGTLITYLLSNGYLQHLINSLVKDCANISLNMKQQQQHSPLSLSSSYYLYQSKMSLFIKLATQTNGCRVLTQYQLLNCLSRCEVFRRALSLVENRSMVCNDYNFGDDDEEDSGSLESELRNMMAMAVQLATNMLTTQEGSKSETIREVHTFVSEFIDVLCSPFQSSSPNNHNKSVTITKEMIDISNMFLLLSSAIQSQQQQHNVNTVLYHSTIDKIITSSLQVLATSLLNQSPSLSSLSSSSSMIQSIQRQYLLDIELTNSIISTITAIVSHNNNNNDSRAKLVFSDNTEALLASRNNWSSSVNRVYQSIVAGDNKPPLSLLVMTLYRVQQWHSELQQKISLFVSLSLSQDRAEHSLLLQKMSFDQLRLLWNNVVGNSDNNDNNSFNFFDTLSKSELINDLLIIYMKMKDVLTGLTVSLESCVYLLYHHLVVYKSLLSSSTLTTSQLGDDNHLHPLQRLTIMEQQQTKREMMMVEYSRNCNINNTTALLSPSDIISIMNKCLDEELLNKIQTSLKIQCGDEESSFSRIIIHRLVRLLKFA